MQMSFHLHKHGRLRDEVIKGSHFLCVDLYDYDTIKVYLVPLQDDGLNLPLEFSFLKLNNGEKKKKKNGGEWQPSGAVW